MESAERGGLSPVDLLAGSLGAADRVAVTGASGWFGATALDLLLDAFGEAASERITGYASAERDLVLPSGRSVRVRALADLLTDPSPQALLHFAYLTRDRVGELGVAEYVERNLAISGLVLAAVRRHRPRLVVTASSGAVYQGNRDLAHDLVSNPYGVLKVLDELAFARACDTVGAGWAIPRVFSVAGAGITKPESYALGSMIAMARAGGPVEIRARRPVYRSYCGVDEVIALAVWTAAHHRSGVFDTGGQVVELADLGAAVAGTIGGGCGVVRPGFDPSAKPDRYLGDPAVFDAVVAESGLKPAGLEDLIVATTSASGR